jgi:hypothetical protein
MVHGLPLFYLQHQLLPIDVADMILATSTFTIDVADIDNRKNIMRRKMGEVLYKIECRCVCTVLQRVKIY